MRKPTTHVNKHSKEKLKIHVVEKLNMKMKLSIYIALHLQSFISYCLFARRCFIINKTRLKKCPPKVYIIYV